GRPHVAQHGPDPGVGQDRVERGGEVRAAVADHELVPVRLFAEVHEQVACLLSGPFPGGMLGDAEEADAPFGVLDYGQDAGRGAAGQVGGEEVAGQDRLGLGAQELGPGWRGPPRRWVDSGLLQNLPCRRRCYLHSQAGQLAVDPAVAPFWVLAGQPEDQGLDGPAGSRPAGPAAHGPRRRRRRTMSRCQRTIVSGGTARRSPWRRALGITPTRAASRARSAQVSFGRRGCRRCRTASWWRRIKISAVFHASSRRDSRSHAASRVVRGNRSRRHMIGDHRGQSVRRATLLVRAVDAILGTYKVTALIVFSSPTGLPADAGCFSGTSSPWASLAPGPDREGSCTAASSAPVRISVPDRGLPAAPTSSARPAATSASSKHSAAPSHSPRQPDPYRTSPALTGDHRRGSAAARPANLRHSWVA